MKRLLYFAMAALMVLAVSCKKNPNGTDPKVQEPSAKTLEANEIGAYSARLHAQIDFAGASRNGVSYGFIWGTSEDTEGTYSPGEGVLDEVNAYTAEIMGLSPETEYWYKAFVEIDGKPYSGDILKFTTAALSYLDFVVDLGIEMTREDGTTYKLYWAKSNLCKTGLCANPGDYGDYFSWGETSAKDDYSWSTYKFGTSASGPFSKYNTNDNKTVLDPGPEGDDVASKILGGNWRMPTINEIIALLALKDNENYTWNKWQSIQNADDSEVYGVQITRKSTGATLFLPATGRSDGTTTGAYAGVYGQYWSSSHHVGASSYAYCLMFLESDSGYGQFERHYGLPVRPVWEE